MDRDRNGKTAFPAEGMALVAFDDSDRTSFDLLEMGEHRPAGDPDEHAREAYRHDAGAGGGAGWDD
jgi:hypothetical protein